jgi:hypothetical protein
MDFPALVTHGLSAISVFREIVSTRLLIAISALSAVAVVLICVVVVVRLTTELAIPGWATFSAGLLLLLLAQMATLTFVLVFFVLASRDSQAFIPGRDCQYFIKNIEQIGE